MNTYDPFFLMPGASVSTTDFILFWMEVVWSKEYLLTICGNDQKVFPSLLFKDDSLLKFSLNFDHV